MEWTEYRGAEACKKSWFRYVAWPCGGVERITINCGESCGRQEVGQISWRIEWKSGRAWSQQEWFTNCDWEVVAGTGERISVAGWVRNAALVVKWATSERKVLVYGVNRRIENQQWKLSHENRSSQPEISPKWRNSSFERPAEPRSTGEVRNWSRGTEKWVGAKNWRDTQW